MAVYDSTGGLLAHALHSQVDMHDRYGGVVPELASRDHIRRMIPLVTEVLARAGMSRHELDAIAYTRGPGLAGALLVGASVATALAAGLDIPAIGIHHLEGHLLSPLLSKQPPQFPFLALLVSGGHTQLMRVEGVGRYELMGETQDDAAGEAFDKTAKLLGLPYPGGPVLAKLAEQGHPGHRGGAFRFPRPMLTQMEREGNLDFSFSGLKTAVSLAWRKANADTPASEQTRADIAAEFQQAVVDVLVAKTRAALRRCGLKAVVVAGGVGANRALRAALDEAARAGRFRVYYPEFELCTDNGAMIAFAGALRLAAQAESSPANTASPITPAGFSVKARWELSSLEAPATASGTPVQPAQGNTL